MTTEWKVSPLPWVWGSARYDSADPGWYLVAADAESNYEVDGLYVGPIGRRMADPATGAVLYAAGLECDGIVASAADRAFIARAVNAHDRLVAAAEDALSMCRYMQQSPLGTSTERRSGGADRRGRKSMNREFYGRWLLFFAILSFALCALLFSAMAFGQTEDFTIKADDQALIFPLKPPGMGSLALMGADESCSLDELFAASDALLALPDATDDEQAETSIAVVAHWRKIAAQCSRVYKAVRDGVK